MYSITQEIEPSEPKGEERKEKERLTTDHQLLHHVLGVDVAVVDRCLSYHGLDSRSNR